MDADSACSTNVLNTDSYNSSNKQPNFENSNNGAENSSITLPTNKQDLEKLFSHANEVKGDLESVLNALVGIIGNNKNQTKEYNSTNESDASLKHENSIGFNNSKLNSVQWTNESNGPTVNVESILKRVRSNKNNYKDSLSSISSKEKYNENCSSRKSSSSVEHSTRSLLSDPGHLERHKPMMKLDNGRKHKSYYSPYAASTRDYHSNDGSVKRSKSVLSSNEMSSDKHNLDINNSIHENMTTKLSINDNNGKYWRYNQFSTLYGNGVADNALLNTNPHESNNNVFVGGSSSGNYLDKFVDSSSGDYLDKFVGSSRSKFNGNGALAPSLMFHKQYNNNKQNMREVLSSGNERSDCSSSMNYHHYASSSCCPTKKPSWNPKNDVLNEFGGLNNDLDSSCSNYGALQHQNVSHRSNSIIDDSSCSSWSMMSAIPRISPHINQQGSCNNINASQNFGTAKNMIPNNESNNGAGFISHFENRNSVSLSGSEDSLESIRNIPAKKIPKLPSLCTQLPSKQGQFELMLISQPEQQHRARYMTEGSRGAVKDRTGSGYPTLQLIGWSKSATLQIFVATEEGRVKTHNFYQACKVSGKQILSCKERMFDSTGLIEIQLEVKDNQIIVLDCIGILKLRNVDVERRAGIQRIKQKSTMARLVFRVNLPHGDGLFTCLQVTSDPILCTQPVGSPEISKMSLYEGSYKGDMELFIIGKNIVKSCQVLFQDHSEYKGLVWQAEAKIELEFLHQTHLICTVPPYCDKALKTPVTVQVVLNCNGRLSEPRYFTYMPDSPKDIRMTKENLDTSYSNSCLSSTLTTVSNPNPSPNQIINSTNRFNCNNSFTPDLFINNKSFNKITSSREDSSLNLSDSTLRYDPTTNESLVTVSTPTKEMDWNTCHSAVFCTSQTLSQHSSKSLSAAPKVASGGNTATYHNEPVVSKFFSNELIGSIQNHTEITSSSIDCMNSAVTATTNVNNYSNSLDSDMAEESVLVYPQEHNAQNQQSQVVFSSHNIIDL